MPRPVLKLFTRSSTGTSENWSPGTSKGLQHPVVGFGGAEPRPAIFGEASRRSVSSPGERGDERLAILFFLVPVSCSARSCFSLQFHSTISVSQWIDAVYIGQY